MQAAVVPNTMTNRLYAPGETEQNHPLINYDDAGNQTKDYYSVLSVNYDRVYDAENRMTSTTYTGSHASSYTYNADGQRVRRKIDGTETWQVYGMDGELLAEYGPNGSPSSPQKEYGYRNGQLLIEVTASGSWGSPPAFTPPATLVAGMEIKVEHLTELRTAVNQLRVKAGVGTTTWTPDPTPQAGLTFIKADHILQLRTKLEDALVALHMPTGGYAHPGLAATTSFIYAIDFQELRSQVLAAWSSGSSLQINWLVSDQLGTPRIILDKTGTLANVKRHDYLPFGEELTTQGLRNTMPGYSGDDIRQKFTLKERDIETGLDYFLARYYSSTQGRFISADSFAGSRSDPQSLNLYTYTLNNPLRFVDPDGHWPQPFPINPIADLLGIGRPSEPMMGQGQAQKPVKIISGGSDSGTADDGRRYHSTLVIKELGEATEPSGVPDWLRTVGKHFFKPAEFLSNRLPDGYTVTGSAFFVFSGHITVTSDLHVLGGLSTPNVGDIIRTGLAHTVLKPVPVSASFVATHIVGPTTTDQRDAFFGGNSFNVSGGYGAYGGVSVSGNRIGVSGGIGSPGIDIGVTRAWPLVNIPHPTFRQMQQRLNKFLTP